VTFAPGQLRKTVTVQVHGNTTPQPDQRFNTTLATPHNAVLADAW
jgi:hypothetical protein